MFEHNHIFIDFYWLDNLKRLLTWWEWIETQSPNFCVGIFIPPGFCIRHKQIWLVLWKHLRIYLWIIWPSRAQRHFLFSRWFYQQFLLCKVKLVLFRRWDLFRAREIGLSEHPFKLFKALFRGLIWLLLHNNIIFILASRVIVIGRLLFHGNLNKSLLFRNLFLRFRLRLLFRWFFDRLLFRRFLFWLLLFN